MFQPSYHKKWGCNTPVNHLFKPIQIYLESKFCQFQYIFQKGLAYNGTLNFLLKSLFRLLFFSILKVIINVFCVWHHKMIHKISLNLYYKMRYVMHLHAHNKVNINEHKLILNKSFRKLVQLINSILSLHFCTCPFKFKY